MRLIHSGFLQGGNGVFLSNHAGCVGFSVFTINWRRRSGMSVSMSKPSGELSV